MVDTAGLHLNNGPRASSSWSWQAQRVLEQNDVVVAFLIHCFDAAQPFHLVIDMDLLLMPDPVLDAFSRSDQHVVVRIIGKPEKRYRFPSV